MAADLQKYAENIILMRKKIKEIEQEMSWHAPRSFERRQLLIELEETITDLKDYQIFMRKYAEEIRKREGK